MLLKNGSNGDDVKKLQAKLGLVADGIFGPGTEIKVKGSKQITDQDIIKDNNPLIREVSLDAHFPLNKEEDKIMKKMIDYVQASQDEKEAAMNKECEKCGSKYAGKNCECAGKSEMKEAKAFSSAARKAFAAYLVISAERSSMKMIGFPWRTNGAYNRFNISFALSDSVPMTTRSGFMKSSTATPSLKNSGFETTSNKSGETFLEIA